MQAGADRGHGASLAIAYGGNNTAGPIDVATAVNAHGGPNGRQDFESETFVAHALRADGFDASEDGTGRGTPIVPIAFDCKAGGDTSFAIAAVRRLTPYETERLQGFPDGYTAIPGAADGPRYKTHGNSMAVPVMRWIGERIAAAEAGRSNVG